MKTIPTSDYQQTRSISSTFQYRSRRRKRKAKSDGLLESTPPPEQSAPAEISECQLKREKPLCSEREKKFVGDSSFHIGSISPLKRDSKFLSIHSGADVTTDADGCVSTTSRSICDVYSKSNKSAAFRVSKRHRTKNQRKKVNDVYNKKKRDFQFASSTPIFRSDVRMHHHPLFLLSERELGKSRDSRRHSSASTPPFSLIEAGYESIPISPKNCLSFKMLLQQKEKLQKKLNIFDLEKNSDRHEPSQTNHMESKGSGSNKCRIDKTSPDTFRSGYLPWKQCNVRSICFSELDTCFSQAIVALDCNGSYMMSIGPPPSTSIVIPNEVKKYPSIPTLALSFFSLPSPAILKQRMRDYGDLLSWSVSASSTINNILNHEITIPKTKSVTSPLVLTIPLQLERRHPGSARIGIDNGIQILSNRDAISSSNIHSSELLPVQILTSQDSCLTVIYLHDSVPVRQETDADPPVGTVIIAPTPYSSMSSKPHITTYRCPNVPMRGFKTAFTTQNLLWPSNFIPTLLPGDKNRVSLYEYEHEIGIQNAIIKECRGYLLFHDEEDGFRITWIQHFHAERKQKLNIENSDQSTDPPKAQFRHMPQHQNVITIPKDMSWETFYSHSLKGVGFNSPKSTLKEKKNFLFESYLHVDALLDDILKRRICKPTSERKDAIFPSNSYVLPDFYYNLISVFNQGRSASLVITFDNQKGLLQSSNPHKAAAIGVILNLDIFDQSYEEIEWMQHTSKCSHLFLRKWSNNLAVYYRMKESGLSECQGRAEGNVEKNIRKETSDCKLPKRKKIIRGYGKDCIETKNNIDISSLYPFCDVTSNQAVLSETPVSKIICRGAPIEIRYG